MLHAVNLSAINLNDVRALHFLLDEAHVARAARKLAITPAAASNALRRLRTQLDDPLLVRSGRTLVRTPRAERLREPARRVLRAAEELFEAGTPFDPVRYEGELVITTSDRVAEVVLPALDKLVSERAPQASLTMRAVTVGVGAFLRDQGGVAIVPLDAREPGLRDEPLFVDDFVCVLRKRHPLAQRRWTVQRFARAEHVLVAPRALSGRSTTDDLLAEHGLARRVSRVVTSFALVMPLLVASDRIAVLPRSFVLARAEARDLTVRPVPVALPAVPMRLVWHPAHEQDPRHVWLRALVREAVRASGLKES